jgi:hypothetical protein
MTKAETFLKKTDEAIALLSLTPRFSGVELMKGKQKTVLTVFCALEGQRK